MQPDLEQIGRIIVRAGEIESALRRNGAAGTGLRELADSVAERLSPETQRLLRYIGTVRNLAAHEGGSADLDAFDPALFEESCRAVLDELGCAPAPLAPAAGAAPAPSPATEIAAGADTRTAGERLADSFRRAALIPPFHLLYPCRLLAAALRPAWPAGSAAGAYLIGALLLWVAVESARTEWLWAAGAVAGGGWLYGAADGWRRRREHPLPQLFYLTPGVNFFYLLIRIAGRTQPLPFWGALAMFGAVAAGVWLAVRHREYAAAAILFGAEYLVGALMALLEGVQARAARRERECAGRFGGTEQNF